MKNLCLFSGLSSLLAVAGFAGESFVYFGTYTSAKSKGIYLSRFDSKTGTLTTPELVAEADNPNFLAVAPDGHFLYAICDRGKELAGAVNAYTLNPRTGQLTLLNQMSSGGTWPCHLVVDATGKCLLTANYANGSIAALPIHADGSLGEITSRIQPTGSSVNPKRQTGPHAHFILPSPDNRFVLACDLGLDKVFAYRLDAATAKLSAGDPPFATVAPGSGPRHLVFSGDGRFVYVVNEMGNTITVFSYDPASAAMVEVQTVSTLPKDFTATNTTAEIILHPSGKFLYASNRGRDSIALFSVNHKTGRLTFVEDQSTQGLTPRHFTVAPDGRWMIVENQDSHSVVMFAIDATTGKLKPSGQKLSVDHPVCAVFVGGR